MDPILRKLSKIQELVIRGERGEAMAAKELLQKMLDKHGISLADLERTQEKRKREFSYVYSDEKSIIFQCIFYVLQKENLSYSSYRGKKVISLEMTDLEYAQVNPVIDFHLKQYRKEKKRKMEILRKGYIHKHNLFGANSDSGPSELTPEQIAEIINMMDSLEDISFHKQISEKNQ
jgi:hypothetical protein